MKTGKEEKTKEKKEENLNGNKAQPYEQLELFAPEEKAVRKTKPAKEDSGKNPSTAKDVQEKTRQKTTLEERKKARKETLRWIKTLNAQLDEVIKQSGKSSEDILLEILGEAIYDPAQQKQPFKQVGKKNVGPAPTIKKEAILKAQEELVPKMESQGQREQNPQVKVTFFPEEDDLILNLVKNGAASPVADLYLHRQALGLLLSPGFEVLLSVKAAQPMRQPVMQKVFDKE
ncbi:hypothetical protein HX99_05110 [Peptococcaceae bacterium SCADC1_2_3]|nr:hypothetical protein HX99_05110 [Peptococcaceae bacterium SCADC1_2_3]